MSSIAIIYFSATGNTAKLADAIQTGANEFFYLTEAQIKRKGIEKEFAFLELLDERAVHAFMTFKGDDINKQVCTNVDFYSGFVYEAIGLPTEVFTPLFAMARITGWSAHRIEELNFASKRIIRPAYKNVGERHSFIPLKNR